VGVEIALGFGYGRMVIFWSSPNIALAMLELCQPSCVA